MRSIRISIELWMHTESLESARETLASWVLPELPEGVHDLIYAQLKQQQIMLEKTALLQLSRVEKVIVSYPETMNETTKKYFKTKSLFKELLIFCSEAKNERISCMHVTT